MLAAWKLALPRSVLLLRGNHESTTCTKMYGFHAELQAKYGVKPAQVTLRSHLLHFYVQPCTRYHSRMIHDRPVFLTSTWKADGCTFCVVACFLLHGEATQTRLLPNTHS